MNGSRIKLLAIILLLLSSGCRPKEEASLDHDDESVGIGRGATQFHSRDRIVGVWAGVGVVDQRLLADKLAATADEVRRGELTAAATAFCSTVVAIEFRADSTMEMDIEMKAIDGEILRDSIIGSWRVIEQSEEVVLVETTEPQPDGTSIQQRLHCEFVGDFNHLAVPAPLDSSLVDCKPAFVFERLGGKSMLELRTADQARDRKYR